MKKQFEKYQSFFEMAKIDKIDDLVIEVYTDHEPPHFHVTKKDCFEVRISIDNQKVVSYKWQKNNKEISQLELKKISKWLNQIHKTKSIKNKDVVELFWDGMNKK